MNPRQREAALRLARTPISERDLQWHGETATLLRQLTQEPQAEPVPCQYAKDVGMPEYRCVKTCQYDRPPGEQA